MSAKRWQAAPIRIECLRKTISAQAKRRKLFRVGLITLRVTVPLYVWIELLTHRRLSRNASSARAMSFGRVLDLGYYHPSELYKTAKGMAVGERIDDREVHEEWDRLHDLMVYYIDGLAQTYNIAKEQLNRLLPTTRVIAGVVTGTQAAWDAFLQLRNHPTADVAMQEVARAISDAIRNAEWVVDDVHLPLEEADYDSIAARLARVSYNRDEEDEQKNKDLARRLKEHKHLSPFEHIAFWRENPAMSNFTSCVDDVLIKTERSTQFWKNDYYGWHQYRKDIE
jgi:hypothetical protein